jgi:outer membrane protein assembly factor BamE (lipoprotein component of BamABCDE complex)
MKIIYAAVFLALSLESAVVVGAPPERELSSYPFIASPKRAALIRENYKRVAPGMSSAEVAKVLGKPDEVRTLYEPRPKNGKPIGHTQWYILKRVRASGSAAEKQESLVRVSFDLGNRVTKIAAWGL